MIAIIFMVIYNPLSLIAGFLILYFFIRIKKTRRTKQGRSLSFAQRGLLIILITSVIGMFLINPMTLILGMIIPFSAYHVFKSKAPKHSHRSVRS